MLHKARHPEQACHPERSEGSPTGFPVLSLCMIVSMTLHSMFIMSLKRENADTKKTYIPIHISLSKTSEKIQSPEQVLKTQTRLFKNKSFEKSTASKNIIHAKSDIVNANTSNVKPVEGSTTEFNTYSVSETQKTLLREDGYVEAQYPRKARILGQEGRLKIQIEVENGKLIQKKLVESSGFPLLDKAALDVVEEWRFHTVSLNFIQSFTFKLL